MEFKGHMEYKPLPALPTFRLVALLDEAIEYEKDWTLPFHSLALCVRENPRDPSWAETAETGERFVWAAGQVNLTAAMTPMRIRYTTANRHLCIFFRHELFPGVDVFSGIRGRFRLEAGGGPLAAKIEAVFADSDPLRRTARAESIALEAMASLWPDRPAINLMRLAPYGEALRTVRDTVDARTGVRDLAETMGLPGAQFARTFRELVGVPPKQWLDQALLDRALSMLADPRRTVRDVAYALAFSDEFNFSHFVKRVSGFSPSRLRKGSD